ncbi:hypothetical protein Agub_g12431 [Astrephomene gubernaculifera]|uniref:Uncharacterized protein n=1 Tax=Astrephomene gubernaculifera TaxID=47775 RepID=A0AAD3DY78_9CHLO|nr:hypothetical protein Agub_g12431 [Astrephomene gubernaculifera]
MLKCVAQLGALTAGFAVSAFYDFQYTASSNDPVLPFFSLATALTVGFELNSCVLCTLMLSSVVKIGKSYLSEAEEAEYLWRLREWAADHMWGAGRVAPGRREPGCGGNRDGGVVVVGGQEETGQPNLPTNLPEPS